MDWNVTLDGTFSDCLNRRNLIRLGLFWLTGIALFAIYAALSGRSLSEAVPAKADMPVLERNGTGALTVWQRDPSHGDGLAYRVVLENLRVENGTLGVFKTASFKVVYIDNLQATFFSSASDGDVTPELLIFHTLFAPRRDASTGASSLGLFHEMQTRNADWSIPVDLAKATEVRIRRLDWQVRQGDETVFRAQCRHAVLRGDVSRMVLRGRVTVTTPAAVLTSNCVEMNVRNGTIDVPGRYSLRCDGITQDGLGERFSIGLKPARGDVSDVEGDQGWANGFRLGSF